MQRSPFPSRLTQAIWIGCGLALSAGAVWLVARDADPAVLSHTLASADYGWVLVGVAAIGATFAVRAWRWAILLQPARYRASTLVAALLAGQTLNFLLPVRAGDVARAVMLGRAPDSDGARALGSVAVEKVWDWLALTGLVIAVALIVPLPEWFVGPARVFGLIAILVLVGMSITLRQRVRGLIVLDRLLARLPFRHWLLARLNRLLDGMEALGRPAVAWRAAVGSAATWLLGVAANVAVMQAFGVGSWPAAMFLMVVLMVGVALPPSIAALGVFEALCVLALGVFGVPHATALAIGLMLHLVVFLPPIVVGAVLMVWETRSRQLLVIEPGLGQNEPVFHD